VEINAPIIDQIEAIELSPDQFNVEKSRLAGMHEIRRELTKPLDDFKPYQLYTFVNCKQVSGLKASFSFKKFWVGKMLLLYYGIYQLGNFSLLESREFM
jgi:hypothetical protein